MILGLITAFAGYTAVYALNDVIDYRVDQEKLRLGGLDGLNNYLDAAIIRHPMAQGLLSLKEGLMWVAAWSLLALVGAYLLNPICLLIFTAGCCLEAVYCLMLRISHLRALVSGVVKTSGGLAAVFAVDPEPSPLFLAILFFWLFLWEIGGQNIPADWTDLHVDKEVHARTIPVQYGPPMGSVIAVVSLALSVAISIPLFFMSPAGLGPPFLGAVGLAGFYLLISPALNLRRTRERAHAQALFNRASYYPLILLLLLILKLLI